MANNRLLLSAGITIAVAYTAHRFFISTPKKKTPLAEFRSSDHYYLFPTNIIKSKACLEAVKLNPQGVYLVAQYYREKYKVNIDFFEGDKLSPEDYVAFINRCRAVSGKDYRCVMLLGVNKTHAVTFTYIRENNLEGMLYLDTIGERMNIRCFSRYFDAPVYTVLGPLQVDAFSCFTNALLFARDLTAKVANNYRLPKLLDKLQLSKTVIEKNIYAIKLPDELLKTTQHPEFLAKHAEYSERKVHKNETLRQFGNRFQTKNVVVRDEKGEHAKACVDDYVRLKGFKLINTMQIQFYLNQIQTSLGDKWSTSLRLEFIQKAKIILQTSDKKDNVSSSRLHVFAENFLMQAQNKTTPVLSLLLKPFM